MFRHLIIPTLSATKMTTLCVNSVDVVTTTPPMKADVRILQNMETEKYLNERRMCI